MTDNCVYNPVFYNIYNGDYLTHNLGIYRKEEDAIWSIYDHITESVIGSGSYISAKFLSDEAVRVLKGLEPENIDNIGGVYVYTAWLPT